MQNLDSYLNKRIEVNQSYGVIRYAGTLQHLTQEELKQQKLDPNQIWLGIEWDEIVRGKHNGIVNGYEYFKTYKNENSATLVKLDKVNFGMHIFDSIYVKYFKQTDKYQLNLDPMQSVMNLKECTIKLGAEDDQKEAQEPQQGNPKPTTDNNAKYQETAKVVSKYQNDEVVKVEYDEEAYIETQKKYRKKIELVGFDKVWQKITNLEQLQELSLAHQKISDIGPLHLLKQLMPQLKILSLENNLLYDWHQVYQLALEFDKLHTLCLSSNKLIDQYIHFNDEKKLKILSNKTIHDEIKPFTSLKYLIMLDMNLTWQTLVNILPFFPHLEELYLCKNKLTDAQNLKIKPGVDLMNLKVLNIEQNDIYDFQPISDNFGHLPNLERLILNNIGIHSLGNLSGFANVTSVSIENNNFEDCLFLHQLSKMPKLLSLRISHNLLLEKKYQRVYLRQRAIADISTLKQINGSELKKYERKDSEIYYMKRTFEEYFAFKNRPHYDYDFDDFINNYCKNHPKLPELIKKFGNPYEVETAQNTIQVQQEKPKIQSHVYLTLQYINDSGSAQRLEKKFPLSTSTTQIKNLCSKYFKIPQDQVELSYKLDENSAVEYLDDNYKSLFALNFKDGQVMSVIKK